MNGRENMNKKVLIIGGVAAGCKAESNMEV
jgi:hypothetical protein